MQTGSQTGLGFLAGVDERVCGGREGQRVVLDRGRLRRVRGFRVCSYAAACVTGHHGREEAGGGLGVGFARGIGVDGGHDCVGDGRELVSRRLQDAVDGGTTCTSDGDMLWPEG